MPEFQVDNTVPLILAPQMYNKGLSFLMIEKSKIDESLREAYQQSEYWLLQPAIQIPLGFTSAAVEELLIDNNCFFACMLTAYNPASVLLSSAENAKRQVEMMEKIKVLKLRGIPALSKDPKGKWPDEQQILILDCPKNTGQQLATAFGQMAILYLELGQPTVLVWVNSSR